MKLDRQGAGRRRFLALGGGAAAGILGVATGLLGAGPALARPQGVSRSAVAGARRLAFHNLHTDETLSLVYAEDGHHLAGAAARINWLLRDYRTQAVHAIDPRVLDLLADLHQKVGSRAPFQIISGYRSPATNAELAARSSGVASHSLHMQGQAVDIRLADVPLPRLRQVAMAMGRGGVGFYPKSDFVHVDVGRVRHW